MLRTHRVGTGVHPQSIGHESVLDKLRLLLIGRGGEQTCGHVDGNLFGVAGAAKHHHVPTGFLSHHLAHAQVGFLFQTLGHGDNHRVLIDVRSHAPADTAKGNGGAGNDHQLRAFGAGVVAADFQPLRQHRVGKTGIPTGGFHFGNQILFKGPHGHIVTVLAQADSQGSSPGTASDNDCLHCLFPFPKRFVFRSSPLRSREILPRCIHTSKKLRQKPTQMGNQPSPQ